MKGKELAISASLSFISASTSLCYCNVKSYRKVLRFAVSHYLLWFMVMIKVVLFLTCHHRVFQLVLNKPKKIGLKFDRLWLRSIPEESPFIEKCNWTLNLTSGNFSNAEFHALDCGLNYALSNRTVNTSKLLASVEFLNWIIKINILFVEEFLQSS